MTPRPRKQGPAREPSRCRHCRAEGRDVRCVVTRDAIGRPRERYPECQGVNTTPADVGTLSSPHPQTATSSHDRSWGAPAPQSGHPRRIVAPTRRG